MDEAKPFKIPKREVWEAFKRVKANQGVGAWMDSRLRSSRPTYREPLQDLEPAVVGELLSAGAAGHIPLSRKSRSRSSFEVHRIIA